MVAGRPEKSLVHPLISEDIMTHPSKGLREQIAQATTAGMVDLLLRTGQAYFDASPATRRAWQRTAARRIEELAKPPKKN